MHARKDLIIIHDGRKMCQIQFLRITVTISDGRDVCADGTTPIFISSS